MKFLVYSAYAIAVLLFSAFARAEAAAAFTIVEVLADPQTLNMEINGYAANPCQPPPKIVVTQVQNVLLLRLTTTSLSSGYCIQKLQNYTASFNLRQLLKASRLPIDEHGVYVVKTEGYDFAVELFGRDLIQ